MTGYTPKAAAEGPPDEFLRGLREDMRGDGLCSNSSGRAARRGAFYGQDIKPEGKEARVRSFD